MEITRITLKNIRCFEKFDVDLTTDNCSRKWLMILGDNGVGKTTILRSIALGLCEESGVSALLADLQGDFIRKNAEHGTIRIELKPYANYSEIAYIETTIYKRAYDEFKVSQKVFPENPTSFSWEKLFVSAYGAGRGIYGTEDVSEYAVTDSVYNLFRYTSPLQNPELVLRRISAELPIENLLEKLGNVLMLDSKSLELSKTGISVRGHWGIPVPFNALGDGYSSTITWILDLYGWKLLFDEHMTDSEVSGIVIIDELEQHLHPKWQKKIVKLLSDQFPKVQFITTSHSPLCVVGTTDLKDEECCITVLLQDDGLVNYQTTTPPRGKRVDQILTSYLFELYTTGDDAVKESIEKYSILYNIKNRSPEEERNFQDLKNGLELALGSPETELEKTVEDAVNKTLVSMATQLTPNLESNSAITFEIKRQLKKLFDTDDKS